MIEINSPIGVFDSGIGGLSVLKQLVRFLPYEHYVYLGDTARVPYGNKSENTVLQYAKESIQFLMSKNVKLIVVACNTVSAVALEQIKVQTNGIPVIGMIRPAAAAAIRSTNNGNIGVIGTRATVQSNAYAKTMLELAPYNNFNVVSKECPLFVPLVEEGFFEHPATKLIAEEYLQTMLEVNIDILVLGCTHYPMLSRLIGNILPNVLQIDTGEQAAAAALRSLAESGMLLPERNELILKHNIDFYVTDYPNHFYELSQQLLGFQIDEPKLVELV
jgi:glutamate racemase